MVIKYSNDKSTASNEGKLPKFGVGRMFKAFEDKAFELKEVNQITKPFLTRFGWHIVKLLKKYPVLSFEVMKKELTTKVKTSGGARMSDLAVLNRLKKKYSIVVNEAAKKVFDEKDVRAKKSAALTAVILTIEQKEIQQYVFQSILEIEDTKQ